MYFRPNIEEWIMNELIWVITYWFIKLTNIWVTCLFHMAHTVPGNGTRGCGFEPSSVYLPAHVLLDRAYCFHTELVLQSVDLDNSWGLDYITCVTRSFESTEHLPWFIPEKNVYMSGVSWSFLQLRNKDSFLEITALLMMTDQRVWFWCLFL